MSGLHKHLSRNRLEQLLAVRCFPKASYELRGEHRDGAIVLSRRGEEWVVFHSERGEEREAERFSTEASACAELLRRVNIAVPPKVRWDAYLREQGFELVHRKSEGIVSSTLRSLTNGDFLVPNYGIGDSEEESAKSAAERWRLEEWGTVAGRDRLD